MIPRPADAVYLRVLIRFGGDSTCRTCRRRGRPGPATTRRCRHRCPSRTGCSTPAGCREIRKRRIASSRRSRASLVHLALFMVPLECGDRVWRWSWAGREDGDGG
jgi:hypothetical protein